PLIFVRDAKAADKELKIVQWSHFVPGYDKWIDQFVRDWGASNGVSATIDHIPHLEIAARMAAELSAQAGHDLVGINGFGPHLYRDSVVDLSPLIGEFEKKYGKVGAVGRSLAYDSQNKRWPAFPDYYISFPGLYRKDLWDEIGMKPDTWDDLRKGGAKLKAKGHPVGIGMGAPSGREHELAQRALVVRRRDSGQVGHQGHAQFQGDAGSHQVQRRSIQGSDDERGAVVGRRVQ